MTDFNHEEYIANWDKLIARAKSLAKTFKRTTHPTEVGKTDLYDGDRTDCKCWELDMAFIKERMHWDEMLDFAEDAQEYIMSVIADGPMCKHCIWNDGGAKSCVHPSIDQCEHKNVEVEYSWRLEKVGTMVFTGIDWNEGTFKGGHNKTNPVTSDGTRTRVAVVTCLKCKQELPLEKIDRDLLIAMEDEY